ncbi:MAG: EamA family transporter [Anaerolineae bacterium]|nr:EamA family transporter [Anaerolineae bacterium]
MVKSLSLILLSVIMGVSGQLCLKMGMGQIGLPDVRDLANLFQIAFRVFTTPLIVAGLAFYALGSLFWLAVLSRLDLSLAYPMLALTYVLVPVTAWLFLGEQVPGVRWLGIGVVIVGVLIISKT